MRKRGFTLIELLVVIAIIALLLSVILPSLRKAKEASKTTVCGVHVRSMTQAWALYAEESKGRIINANQIAVGEDASAPEGYSFAGQQPTWAGNWLFEYNRKALEAAIRIGLFYPYVDTIKVYRCTNHETYNKGLRPELAAGNPIYNYAEQRLISYNIVDSMNGATAYGSMRLDPYKKISDIRNASVKLVFLDRGQEGRAGWSIFPNVEQFYNPPGIQHNNGTIVSFVDGHSEHWRWEDPRTAEFTRAMFYGTPPAVTSGGNYAVKNSDFMKLLQATWGTSKLNK